MSEKHKFTKVFPNARLGSALQQNTGNETHSKLKIKIKVSSHANFNIQIADDNVCGMTG